LDFGFWVGELGVVLQFFGWGGVSPLELPIEIGDNEKNPLPMTELGE